MVLQIQALGSSETSVSSYRTAHCNTHYPHLADPKSHEPMNVKVTGPNEEIHNVSAAFVTKRNPTEVCR